MSTIEKRDPFRFGKSDQWLLWLGFGVLAVAAVFAYLVQPVGRWIHADPVPVSYQGRFGSAPLDRAGLTYDVQEATAQIPGTDAWVHLLDLAPGLLAVLLIAAGGSQLVGLGRSIATGNPFDRRNVRRLRVGAAACIVGGAAMPVAQSVSEIAAIDRAGLTDILRPDGFSVHVSLAPLLAGLLLGLLAEAFAAGSRMRADLEGVI